MAHIHFMAGLPRSGSTLLTKILSQHHDIFATSTSPVLDYLIPAANHLHHLKNTHASGHYIDIQRTIKAASFSFYNTNKTHIIDKNRGWINFMGPVQQDLTNDPKLILTLRPIEEVVASFYKVYNYINDRNLTPGHIYEHSVKGIFESLINNASLKNTAMVVTYRDITTDTKQTMLKIEQYLGAGPGKYDFDNIQDQDTEDDQKWGIKDLHKIRPAISVQSLDPLSVMTLSEYKFCQQLTQQLYNAYEITL